MSNFGNSKKTSFLDSIPTASVESDSDVLSKKCKFNFSYFDASQDAGQDFADWSHLQLVKLMNKLINYSESPLKYWENQRVGAGGLKLFVEYGSIPKHSEFFHPKHIPHEAVWARFHLEGKVRLIGFTLPEKFHQKKHPVTGEMFDCNTFYVVFLDSEHRFYPTK